MKRILLLACLLWAGVLAAQEKPVPPVSPEKPKTTGDWRIDGTIGIATNGEAIFLNFGGPNIRFQYKKVAWGLSLYPSLRAWDDAPRTFLMPTLGFGAFLHYKRWGLIAPMYYNSAKNEWMPTGGICFKLSK